MVVQKFKRGDVVKFKFPFNDQEKIGIIVGSYYDLCGGHKKHGFDQYQIKYNLDDSIAWIHENEIQLVIKRLTIKDK